MEKRLVRRQQLDGEYKTKPIRRSGSNARDGNSHKQSRVLCGEEYSEISLMQEALRFIAGRGYYCGANLLFTVGIDETGRLFKCWENAADPKFSFANARDWDPRQPLETAFAPDMMIQYLNAALPLRDEECNECVWLPACADSCPHRRLHDHKTCIGLRNEPEKYVLALHSRIGREKQKQEEQEKREAQ